MPHATMPPTGFQVFILCGPGESLNPFNSNPKDFPKALIPIANRPMVWYPLDWCHRMGISALALDPYLTSLPTPKPTVLAPSDLALTTGTAEIFRLREVQDAITSDFIILPCDLVSELPGSSLLEAWMTLQGGLGGATGGNGTGLESWSTRLDVGGEKSGRRGGLGVWYQTKDDVPEGGVGVKKEETDFLATTEISNTAISAPVGTLHQRIRNVVMTMPTDALKDTMDEKGALNVRHQLLRKHGNVRMLTTHRDAHIYLLPYWVKEYMNRNDVFESIGEDALGWWAKAGWQEGLSEKLQFQEVMRKKRRKSEPMNALEDAPVDIAALSSTTQSKLSLQASDASSRPQPNRVSSFASRVGPVSPPPETETSPSQKSTPVPPLLAYMHPAPTPLIIEDPKENKNKQQQKQSAPDVAKTKKEPHIPLIRRTDTVPLLLSISLYLARLPALSDYPSPASPSSLSHAHKAHPTSTLPTQSTIDLKTVLIDANCTLQPRITLRECTIGASVSIASGSRLTRCVVMEGVVIEEKVVLTGCVLGRRCKIGKGSELRDCQVEEKFVVAEGSTGKGEVMAGFDEGAEGGFDDDADFDGEGDGIEM
ncbi:hypothetical protein FH972_025443 [Carpinus fangiana]|uniref:Translation initiation factor eIF2B subunit gamma n=1 Tax=Carpinus fangiana TaxID=176857 RepID=A0A5N6L1G1_9ROSI|nr:hypothetical protein FH972_025443 [Carpinus fangiana]